MFCWQAVLPIDVDMGNNSKASIQLDDEEVIDGKKAESARGC